jgi:prolipoprotein diacylglyceryl transferase
MYPSIYDMFYDLFGVQWLPLKFVQTFGFFVALSFLASNFVMTIELKRKEKEGLIQGQTTYFWEGKMSPWSDFLTTALTGFLLGWKILYAFTHLSEVSSNPQAFILSSQGSVLLGVSVAALLTGYKYYAENKAKLEKPVKHERIRHPYEIMGNVTLIAAVAGFAGAKIFHHLENWDEFMADPIGALSSPFSGLTFYGGLICGGAAVLWYAAKNGVPWRIMLDVGAPTMMLAYALGRVGCHMSGDGDWGIVNTVPKPGWMSFLPDWIWSYNYPNNVNQVCNPFTGNEAMMHSCNWEETPYLIAPVFPTPFYETLVCLLLFGLIWMVRRKFAVAGTLFFFYLILNGLERFMIEKIRVNTKYQWGSLEITQAEIISFTFVIVGVFMLWYLIRSEKKNTKSKPEFNPSDL